ncbi:MAG: CrcB family protein [Phycisphaerae bacterium]
MMHIALIGIGGAVGSILRFLLSNFATRVNAGMPIGDLSHVLTGTLIANALGSFLMGFMWSTGATRLHLTAQARDAITIGLLGGFTTFSTFANDTRVLFASGLQWMALLNIILHNTLAILGAFAGFALGQRLGPAK